MKEEDYIKSYPHDTYTERVDADKLAEGRIYLIETSRAETRFLRAYVCVKQVLPSDGGIVLHFGIYIERAGMMVHITDPHAETYQSVSSLHCANVIYKDLGVILYDDYNFFVPSQDQVKDALDNLRSLGYMFIDDEMRRINIAPLLPGGLFGKRAKSLKTNKNIKDYGM